MNLKTLWWIVSSWVGWKTERLRYGQCDSCSGVFRTDLLLSTSGDWWLCEECMDHLLAEMRMEGEGGR